MSKYHRYASAYPSPDYHGRGYCDECECLRVNSVGIYNGECPSVAFLQERRNDYYFSYAYKGGMYLKKNGALLEVGQGDAFFLTPGQPCTYWYKNESDSLNYFIHFTGHAADKLLNSFGAVENQIITLGQRLEIGNMFNQIVSELELKDWNYQVACSGFLMQLIAEAARGYRERDAKRTCENHGVISSLQYIHDHYMDKLLVSNLAKNAAMSVNKYEIEFRSHTGVPPLRYILMYRLEKAIGYIADGDYSIGEISELVGFEDQMQFSRMFKKYIKTTPSQYKKNYIADLGERSAR